MDNRSSPPGYGRRSPTELPMVVDKPRFSIRQLLALTTLCGLYFALQHGEPKFTVSNFSFVWLTLAANALFFCLLAIIGLRFCKRRGIVAAIIGLAFLINSGNHLVYAIEYTLTGDSGPFGAFLDRTGLGYDGPVYLGINAWVTE
ncbi:hypothetical protein Poly51_59550 [Rubripirellula tenax]|uniref:Uncharacterized protein n=1 Tax=Rubripirellula tenax TaxID=2528015 RepID=A0A5C6EB15_9BACT|nr:hypothetical protein [Rubripirellula tenax]TWU44686.1 hypothetical protein Poly51_59550 [Rubripirellula tenax]